VGSKQLDDVGVNEYTPELRWGHTMNAAGEWVVVFSGHRRRGSLNDIALLDTRAVEWVRPHVTGTPPPPRGNHAAVVVASRLWVFGGDAPATGLLPQQVYSATLPHDGLLTGTTVAWECPQVSGEPPPPCCDHAAVGCGSRVLVLGGSSGGGYLPLDRIAVFDTGALAWAWIAAGAGGAPSARAGHVAAALPAAGGGARFRVLVFGGGNSETGFNDVAELAFDGKASWRKCAPARGADPPPLATEGAAVALSGGVLVVCGGYTSAGATSQTYAWACEAPEAEGVDAKLKLLQAAKDGGALSQALYEQARRELYDV